MIQIIYNKHWKKHKGNKSYIGYGAVTFHKVLKLDIFSDSQKSSEQNLINFLKICSVSSLFTSGESISSYII